MTTNSQQSIYVADRPLASIPPLVRRYPQLRFMGSKHRLLEWIHDILREYRFETALDPFCGSGVVSYLMKAMGKTVFSSDFLHFCTTIAMATIENSECTLTSDDAKLLTVERKGCDSFILDTFRDIFFTREDLRFLDMVWCNLPCLRTSYHRALALTALVRSCVKRQPRGVFTVSGDSKLYDDGRRDLRLCLEEHFYEQVSVYNKVIFDNGRKCKALKADVFELPRSYTNVDLVYLDPPYVPRADDNCYVKRYHFLEGLTNYWRGEEIMYDTKVRKIKKKYTPFSYRKEAVEAFRRLFEMFRQSTIVLSYSSNGYPDLGILVDLMKLVKKRVTVHERNYRYHFGTHSRVKRAEVVEYLITGTD